jgi:uncharacterized repeat protein (TIGR02543 family)
LTAGTRTRNAYKDTFDTGGVAPAPEPLTAIPYDNKITDPGVTKTGYTFDGWYKEAAKWDFGTDTVTEDIDLYAKWAVWLLSKETLAMRALWHPSQHYYASRRHGSTRGEQLVISSMGKPNMASATIANC